MVSMKEVIEEIKEEMRDIIERTETIKQHLDLREIQLKKIVNLRIRMEYGNESSVCLIGGFLSKEWEPKIYVYPFSDGKKTFLKINGKWTWYNETAVWSDVYSAKIIKDDQFDQPFNPDDLERDCKKLEDDLGIPVNIVEYNIKVPTNPASPDDLLEKYPTGKILASGKLWSIGWDIPDYWAILELDDGKHVFYSTNGHGMGYDNHIEPGEYPEKFMEIVTGNSGYAPVLSDVQISIDEILFGYHLR